MSKSSLNPASRRMASVDAYRGFVMLAMVSGGFAFAIVVRQNPDLLAEFDGTRYAAAWKMLWRTLAYQFEHVAWTGCAFWDLIQPSFMFLVGVAMPFSFVRRQAEGQSGLRRFGHVVFRSLVLVALGVFLSSNWSRQTHFTFVNVLTQIGLGYPIVYLLLGRRFWLQSAALVGILGGYWYYFYQHTTPPSEYEQVTAYLQEVKGKDEAEWSQFDGLAAQWNKHTNAAAAFDRWFLNLFPRDEEEWNGRRFWVNDGGYQTLNFIPSMATMLMGLMAGQLLLSGASAARTVRLLMLAGLGCFALAMAVDTTIWPVRIAGADWSLCPTVKRIWTPTWAVFSAGWSLWMLAAFYWVIDVRGWKRWAFPLAVVGMNSIAMYCMAQLIKGWVGNTLEIHLRTVDAAFGSGIVPVLFGSDCPYAPILRSLAVLFVLWLFCLWLYRQKIFVKV